MRKIKESINYLDNLYKELEVTRNRLYALAMEKNSFNDKEVVAVSMKLDELIIAEMKVRELNLQ
jgi:hypothetical protein